MNGQLNFKDAVRRAKAFVEDALRDEGATQIGLEEIEYDEGTGVWNVTIGFERPSAAERLSYPSGSLTELMRGRSRSRDYKVVKVRDADGEVVSMHFLDPAR